MPQPNLPPRCCGRCKHGVPTKRNDQRIQCKVPLPIWLVPLLIHNGNTAAFLRDSDGGNCCAFEPKDADDA